MNVIGFCGLINSGKGTLSDYLVNSKGYVKESFAGPVKDICAVRFNWPRHMLEGDTKESREFRETPDPYWSEKFGKPFTPRHAMQLEGTEVGRNFWLKNLWVDLFIRRVSDTMENYVVSDVRFPNEIEAIRSIGGKVYTVWREIDYNMVMKAKQLIRSKIDPTGMFVNGQHYSEWAWMDSTFDGMILNDGTLDDLYGNLEYHMTNDGKPVTCTGSPIMER